MEISLEDQPLIAKRSLRKTTKSLQPLSVRKHQKMEHDKILALCTTLEQKHSPSKNEVSREKKRSGTDIIDGTPQKALKQVREERPKRHILATI